MTRVTAFSDNTPELRSQSRKMESSGVEKGGESIKSSSQPFASTGSDTAREKGNVLTKPAASSKEETGAGQQGKTAHHSFCIIHSSPEFSKA